MRISLFIDPQEGMAYDDIASIAVAAEASGFSGIYRSDHLTSTAGAVERVSTEAWSTIAGLARDTNSIRLGTLVSPIGFRHPSVYAKIVNTVDSMSGGRVDASLGTGWYEPEHTLFGLPFSELAERYDEMREYLACLDSLWSVEPRGHTGSTYSVGPVSATPRVRNRPRLIIGGHGKRKTPALVARYGDEFNIDWPTPESAAELFQRVDRACQAIGRPVASVTNSVLIGAVVGRDDRDVEDRVRTARSEPGLFSSHKWLETHSEAWTTGSPRALLDTIGRYRDVGVEHLVLMLAPSLDLAQLNLIGEAVIPEL